jgi:DNA-binding LytR/AlgR family response regulator
MIKKRAIIADDEKALRDHLRMKLATFWPDLEISGEAGDGEEALRLIGELKPDVAFLDIQMPVRSGLEVARYATGPCLFVFVTAFDKYAIEAFENAAIDYLLKPVSDERLKTTIKRLKDRLSGSSAIPDLSAVLEKIAAAKQKPDRLQWIKAQYKGGVRLIPVADILYFRAADKYTTVRTREAEYVISTPIKELEAGLDPARFWRVHRAAIVNAKAAHVVGPGLAGTLTITFRDIPDHLSVSRAYAHLFKQM